MRMKSMNGNKPEKNGAKPEGNLLESGSRRVLLLQFCMWAVNCVAVAFICIFIYHTTQRIRGNYQARFFLDSISTFPRDPKMDLWICLTLMGVLAITFFARNWWMDSQKKWAPVTLVIDFLACAIILYRLNFNYNGLILLVFANIITYVRHGRLKLLFVILGVTGYLLADANLLSIYFPLYRVNDYILYYTSTQQQYLFSVYNILGSLNIILFIIYCIYVINQQFGTIQKVNSLYRELQDANDQLRHFADMSERMAQTRERNRLAREIHDTLGHTLTGITAGLDACLALIDVSPEETKKQLELLSKVSREGIKDVRRSVNELRPDALRRLSLRQAISEMVAAMSQVSDVDISFETDEQNLRFDEDEEDAIYRVIQEGITNAVRHGHASHIFITLHREDQELLLTIHDDGIGASSIHGGFGIRHIRERIELLQGSVEFDGSNGFTITAHIPIRRGESYD